MDILLFTSPVDFAGECENLEEMFATCPFSLQIRKPHHSERQLERFLLSLPQEIREMAVLHGDQEMAQSFSLMGYAGAMSIKNRGEGCGAQDLPFYAVCSKEEELENLPQSVSGAFLYPYFDSLSEPHVQGLYKRSEISESVIPGAERAFACGGITEDDFLHFRKRGFKGAAVCGGVWNYADPLAAWLRVTRASRRIL